MAYAKTKTGAVVALLATVPIGLQWSQNRELRRELAGGRSEWGEVGSGKSDRDRERDGGGARRSVSGRTPLHGQAGTPDHHSRRAGLNSWRRALAVQDPVLRAQRFAELIARLDGGSAPEIAELFFGDGAGGHSEAEAGLFLRAWARIDGARAIAYLEARKQAGSASAPMLAALGGWASKDPEAARAWAEAVEKHGLREDLLFGVIDGWALVDFNAAASFAETRPRSEARTRFIDLLFNRSLVAGGIAGAQNWFAGIPDNDHNSIYKRRAFDKIVATMLRGDPSEAAQWIASHAGEAYLSRNTVQTTATKLAASSPQEALDWLSSMPALSEEISAGSQGEIISQWAGQDPVAAGTWLSANGNHPNYDTMARNYSTAVAVIDGEGAMEWAQSIQDEGKRQAAVLGVAQQRIKVEGDSAIEALRLAGLSEEELSQATRANQAMSPGTLQFTTRLFTDAIAPDGVRIWDVNSGGETQIEFAMNNQMQHLAADHLVAAVVGLSQGSGRDLEFYASDPAFSGGSLLLETTENGPDPFGRDDSDR